MRLCRVLLAAALVAGLSACSARRSPSAAPPASGTCLVSHNAVGKDRPSSVRLGGRTFQITLDKITWDGGSLALADGWGLLELLESPTSIAINVDGVKRADVPK